MTSNKELLLYKKELEMLKLEQRDRELHPFKYFDFYEWQYQFINQEEHIEKYGRFPMRLYLTCANQVGKTFAIMELARKCCCDQEFRKWHWKNNQPKVFWYSLPSQDHINDFFYEKWEPEVLARDEAKEKGPHAWKLIKKGSDVQAIYFLATKVTLRFVTLGSRGSNLQGRSIGGIFFDEEPPVEKLGELEMRTASFNDPDTGESLAIMAFAFTATTAQEYFKKVFNFQDERFLENLPEDLQKEFFWDEDAQELRTCSLQEEQEETFKESPTIWKRRVSMFEAQEFRSGKKGKYTEQRIREIIRTQPTKRDVMVRVFAGFEREDTGGLIYKYFDRNKHIKAADRGDIDFYKSKGLLTAGIDYGSGSNHPGGFVVTWISPDKTQVRVIKMWRGEKGKITTAGDIIETYLKETRGMNIHFPFYDFSCADLNTIYNRITGKELIKASKDKDGYGTVDTLLKHNMLKLLKYDDEPYADWAAQEFTTINWSTSKKDRLDELTDCVRYSLHGVHYMFNLDNLKPIDPKEQLKIVSKKDKTPEDYGVRSWNNVKEDDDDYWEENYTNTELNEWEGYFNE